VTCKPGDLAIIVHTHPGLSEFLGRIFLCESRGKSARGIAGWKTPWKWNGRDLIAPDVCLRPIRDNDKEDETLTWAPRKETA
jgi:hypothetical protein